MVERVKKIMYDKDWEVEKAHFNWCEEMISHNLKEYQRKVDESKKESEKLYEAYQSGDVELYDQLVVSDNNVQSSQNVLRKNQAAFQKPYFGRIDYVDHKFKHMESIYIGKNGISKDSSTVIIADWRTPIASVYYENSLGDGSYTVPGGEKIKIDLQQKRTYDIDNHKLIGYFDSDAATNDELLVKYLAKNKEAVLSDIISTIQDEQNYIIRENPFKNIIVQGVAGSGKTTVALHKISYILYNYGEKIKPVEFCIIGSNEVLLNYITSGLPDLDVHNINQMRMDTFFCSLAELGWKKEYRLTDIKETLYWRNSLGFASELEEYLNTIRNRVIPLENVSDPSIGVILSKESIEEILRRNCNCSVNYLVEILNERIENRIDLLINQKDIVMRKTKKREYKSYFSNEILKKTALELYVDFLVQYMGKGKFGIKQEVTELMDGNLDIYDVAALALIIKRILEEKEEDNYSQIIIDEAQDFGVMLYYVLRQILPKCYFTIMGDVSQNVNDKMGLDCWDDLQHHIFNNKKDKFYLLSKSYRNTIEISNFAGRVLEKASAGIYKIEPVIRHGKEVNIVAETERSAIFKVAELVNEIIKSGYNTIAVVCYDENESNWLKEQLKNYILLKDAEKNNFGKGVMVLPIRLTKGLEFDAVILWDPNSGNYKEHIMDVKLLYVAITRALHELHIVHKSPLSKILK